MSRKYDELVQLPLDECTEENEVPGYEGVYATENGDIYKKEYYVNQDIVTERAKVVKKHWCKDRYNVRLTDVCGRKREPYVHRLVAETHIPNPKNYPLVRHLDDDTNNNSVHNLAWGTPKDNHEDAVRNGRYKPVTDEARAKGIEITRKPVWAEKDGERKEYRSIAEAKRATGAVNANKVLSGERKQACGYKFGYLMNS